MEARPVPVLLAGTRRQAQPPTRYLRALRDQHPALPGPWPGYQAAETIVGRRGTDVPEPAPGEGRLGPQGAGYADSTQRCAH